MDLSSEGIDSGVMQDLAVVNFVLRVVRFDQPMEGNLTQTFNANSKCPHNCKFIAKQMTSLNATQ